MSVTTYNEINAKVTKTNIFMKRIGGNEHRLPFNNFQLTLYVFRKHNAVRWWYPPNFRIILFSIVNLHLRARLHQYTPSRSSPDDLDIYLLGIFISQNKKIFPVYYYNKTFEHKNTSLNVWKVHKFKDAFLEDFPPAPLTNTHLCDTINTTKHISFVRN